MHCGNKLVRGGGGVKFRILSYGLSILMFCYSSIVKHRKGIILVLKDPGYTATFEVNTTFKEGKLGLLWRHRPQLGPRDLGLILISGASPSAHYCKIGGEKSRRMAL